MKTIIVSNSVTTGLDPAFASVRTIEIDDSPIGQGGFGVAHRMQSINRAQAPPQIVKLLIGPSPAAVSRGLDTTRALQQRLQAYDARLRKSGASLVTRHPALAGVPQVSFEGSLDGKPVAGYTATDLITLGMEDFGGVLADAAKCGRLQLLPLAARMSLAAQLVDAFEVLSTHMHYIHADIKAEAIFVDLASVRCAVIDFDSGAVARDPSDTPTTFGTRQDWLAPEIVRQLDRAGNTSREITVNLLSDVWSVNIAIHYLLYGCSPFFFLTEVSDRSMKAYAERFRWPEADATLPYFRRDYASTHASYVNDLRRAMPKAVVNRLAFTMDRGYRDPTARTSYGQWKAVLNGGLKPAIERFEASRTVVCDARPVRLEWEVSGARRVEISGVGDVAGRTSVEVRVRRDTTFTLTVVPLDGRPISRSIGVTVSRAPATIVRFAASKVLVREGDSVTLEWDVRDAAEVAISPGPDVVPVAGRAQVRAGQTTTFTLTATSFFGVVTKATAVVRVVASTKLLPASRRTALRAPTALVTKRTLFQTRDVRSAVFRSP